MINNHVVSRQKPSKHAVADAVPQAGKHRGSEARWWRACRELVDRMHAEARAEQRHVWCAACATRWGEGCGRGAACHGTGTY